MTIIHTGRNRVITEQPEHDDVFVRVGWSAPAGDGKHLRPITLPYRPVSEYQQVLDWAVSVAEQFVHPLYVVPLNHGDILNTGRWKPFADFIANMNDQEWGELRHIVVTRCCQVMRDCPDPKVRSDAYDILTQLKVARHESQ